MSPYPFYSTKRKDANYNVRFSLSLKIGNITVLSSHMLLVLKKLHREKKIAPPSSLVASSSTISTTAQDILQQICPPMLPPKYANKNGAHHEKIEGVGGNLLVVLWPPQGRSDDMHGKILSPMMILSSMLSSK